jgi:hypothetical protein
MRMLSRSLKAFIRCLEVVVLRSKRTKSKKESLQRFVLLGAIPLLAMGLKIGPAFAEKKPPANAKPLSETARTIEKQAGFQSFECISKTERKAPDEN